MSEKVTKRAGDSEIQDESLEEEHTPTKCPECSGSLIRQGVETLCEDCGLVADFDTVTRGPDESRYGGHFNDDDEARSRVGPPLSEGIHDRGLSTDFNPKSVDGYGNTLSYKKKQKYSRLKTWHNRSTHYDDSGTADSLIQGNNEINRMSSALGLSQNVREMACVIYRKARSADCLLGRSIEGIASACLYAATKIQGTPRNVDEVLEVSRLRKRRRITRSYNKIQQELDLEVGPASPREYLSRYGSELYLPNNIINIARDVLAIAEKQGVVSGRNPSGMAASALYVASNYAVEVDCPVTQSEAAEIANVSEVTIRNQYTVILNVYHSHQDEITD